MNNIIKNGYDIIKDKIIFDYKVTISFIGTRHYNFRKWNDVKNFIFGFNKYRNIKGIHFRIFGIFVNIREKDATNKLIKIAQEKGVYKSKL